MFHLFTHGKPGHLYLSDTWMNAPGIAKWLHPILKNSTNNIRHLNIYGCEFGKGVEGKQAVAYLQQVLGITIAASNNLTGKDGDWVLEVGDGTTAISAPNYTGNLQCTGVLGDTGPTDDFDGDGVCNQDDIDDDNDGILDKDEACALTSEIESFNPDGSAVELTLPSGITMTGIGTDITYELANTITDNSGSGFNMSNLFAENDTDELKVFIPTNEGVRL